MRFRYSNRAEHAAKRSVVLFVVSFVVVYFPLYSLSKEIISEVNSIDASAAEHAIYLHPAATGQMFHTAIIIAFLIAAAHYVYSRLAARRGIRASLERQEEKEAQDANEYAQVMQVMPYKSKYICTIPEKDLWDKLQRNINHSYYICPKPSLKEFIKTTGDYDTSDIVQRAWRETSQKHVDFLVCAKNKMWPLFAIEYDDSTHTTSERTVKSDAFKNKLFAKVGIPLVRVPYKKWTDNELKMHISSKLMASDDINSYHVENLWKS